MVDFDVLLVVENWEGILGSEQGVSFMPFMEKLMGVLYKLDQEIQIPRFG